MKIAPPYATIKVVSLIYFSYTINRYRASQSSTRATQPTGVIMFIPVNAIRALIEKYDNISAEKGYMPASLLTVITDLENLVKSEEANLDQMAEDWEAQEDGRRVMEDARDQKLIEQDMARFDWPGGV